ncbi:MAG TPA: phosphatase PAP2 family protein [Bacteriovoracaceae bacterium]|nr:phosphatase PAP2 family protein [Bacteriovoracaceae bacterium]
MNLDTSLFLQLNSLHASWLDPLMVFASGQFLWIPFILYFIYFAAKNLRTRPAVLFGLFLVLTLIACDVTSSYILKNIFERLRPCKLPELKLLIHSFGQKCGGKYGFVSSHAANSTAIIQFALLTLPFTFRFKHLFWVIPCLVAYSRIYLGVHYPGDVLGGAVVGIFWASAFAWMFNRSRARS